MEPSEEQRPKSGLSSVRSSSFARFIKKSYSLTKKDKKPEPSSTTQEEDVDANGRVYIRPQRRLTLTEADLKNNVVALQTAMDDTWPLRHHSRYRNARALLVCWADSDSSTYAPVTAETFAPVQSYRSPVGSPVGSPMGSPVTPRFSYDSHPPRVSSERRLRNSASTIGQSTRQGPFVSAAYQLANVLERCYGIRAQVWLIPSLENPQNMLAGKIKQFVDMYGGPDSLLIFWYGGLADFAAALPKKGTGGGNGISSNEIMWHGSRDEPGISARTIIKTLSLGLARADVLMLNDSPFAQHAYASHIEGPGTFELLGPGSTHANYHAASFTRTLSVMLNSPHLANQGVSVLELHRKLLDIASDPGSRTTTTLSATQMMRGPAYPVYVQLVPAEPIARHIVLSRLETPLAAKTNYARDVGEPGVNIYFRLARSHLEVKQWKEWMLGAPEEVREVSVSVPGKADKGRPKK
ncbi:hypothetical protein F4678DRAFT_293942 [Xylaria arbuscula]|nr:hypothetical protein F4678DRAFT_293942 [Xylaria arbuscula]